MVASRAEGAHKHACACAHVFMHIYTCAQALGNKGHGKKALWQKKQGSTGTGDPFKGHAQNCSVHTQENVEAYLNSKDARPANTHFIY